MVTLVLSSNMRRMLKNNVLVRKLVGIETAGSLNILFTDKTGTITKGKLEVISLMLGNQKEYSNINNLGSSYKNLITKSLVYNNESTFDSEDNKIIGGNITDKAILEFVNTKKTKSIKELDKIRFNKSSSLSTWGKEYIFSVGTQTIHALVYTIFIGITYKIVLTSDVAQMAVCMLAFLFFRFMTTAETLLRGMLKLTGDSAKNIIGDVDSTDIKDLFLLKHRHIF